MTETTTPPAVRVVIAGGGVAGLEALLALRALAADRVALTLVTPEDDFTIRALTVREPFRARAAAGRRIDELCRAVGADLVTDVVARVDVDEHRAITGSGTVIPYDALVVATGASSAAALPQHALTIGAPQDGFDLHGLVEDIEGGYVHRLAVIVPSGTGWAMPAYEFALLAADRADDLWVRGLEVTLLTAESAPISAFGLDASVAMAVLLQESGIAVVRGVDVVVTDAGVVHTEPDGRTRHFDRLVSLALLEGRAPDGIPTDADGFVDVDPHGRVAGVPHVFAAGDGTSFPVKQGGLAAQQAVAVAAVIAASAGADIAPAPFRPVLRGRVLTGARPRFLRSDLTADGESASSVASSHTLWWPPAKLAAPRLTHWLQDGGLTFSVPDAGVDVQRSVHSAPGDPGFELLVP
jgi:sulfide:quinone oxidoreductase